ncbi:MAG: hypothetical protein OXG60_08940 [Chloroflexi bacterium]|nr:hypothetical protein [Chloroflexota bacterium]
MDIDKMRRGIIPGIIAGYVFLAYVGAGAGPARMGENGSITITAANGMIDMIGGMIGADAFVGFILHIVISLVIGALYTGLFKDNVYLGNPLMDIAVGGLIYGLIWWILGGNIIMPLIAGSDILQLSIGPSFYGHIIYGHVLVFLVVLRDQAFGLEYIDGRKYAELPKRKRPGGLV